MRLLSTKELQLQLFPSSNVPKYAILSHVWNNEEVIFQDMEKKAFKEMKRGFSKLQSFCAQAAKDGYEWVWIDTCCIDKTNSAELSEAINSMYSWYRDSTVCYAYLEDLETIKDFDTSVWFSRGWTLQELIAPRRVVFFDALWQKFGTRTSLVKEISSITGIPTDTLLGKSPYHSNVAQRMSWASTRQTTREEDMTYCLMGLFDIHMPPIYGEGPEKAFLRLQQEILLQNSDQTLFLWTPSHEPYNQGLLATSPKAFCTHYDCFDWWHVLEKVPRDQFSPYSFLRPVSRRPSMRTFDEYCGETSVETTDGTVHQASLGQNGLQISVLADFGVPGQDETARRNRIICFDILAVGPKYRTAILLLLEPDLVYDYTRGFIPNRRGDMRRRVCSEPGSNYLHALPNLSFKRTNITVSQLNTSACKPGSPAFFKFLSSGVTPLASDITVFKADDTVEMPPTVADFFECSGGIAKVKHPCTRCDQDLLFMFGTRGLNFRPWCCYVRDPTTSLPGSNVRSLYQQMELMSARFYEQAMYALDCEQGATVDIYPAEDEDCYVISIGFVA